VAKQQASIFASVLSAAVNLKAMRDYGEQVGGRCLGGTEELGQLTH
jgi:hypothetical protein